MSKHIFAVFLLLLFFTPNRSIAQINGLGNQPFYQKAFDLVFKELKNSGKVVDQNDISIGAKHGYFNLGVFADKFSPKNFNHLIQIRDSLKEFSDEINDLCKDSSIVLNVNVNNASKYVLFFSKVCSNKLQADLFLSLPALKENEYLSDYYGTFQRYWFEFDGNNCIKFYYSTDITAN